jgi:hypothetical protein
MDAKVVSRDSDSVTLQVRVPMGGTMLENEEGIQAAVNEVGRLATQVALERFDTDGEPIVRHGVKMTSKAYNPKEYQTPYGPVEQRRHTYQSSRGGRIYCPLDDQARILVRATPRFAKVVSQKFSREDARAVVKDLEENHGRPTSLCLVQNIGATVGAVAEAAEEHWDYELPRLDQAVWSIGLGVDGTCMLMVEGAWRQAMVGTVSLYSKAGERLHTTYIGAAPEAGRETFLKRMNRAIGQARATYPKALFIGLADGAPSNWEYLAKHVEMEVLDFYHVSEYLTEVADVVYSESPAEREKWLESACHRLKHEFGAPAQIIREVSAFNNAGKFKDAERKVLEGTINYIRNNKGRMPYANNTRAHLPIGSGPTEAACKVIIKERLCCSGMRWKPEGAGIVITLRCLTQTPGYWQQFWEKVTTRGYS